MVVGNNNSADVMAVLYSVAALESVSINEIFMQSSWHRSLVKYIAAQRIEHSLTVCISCSNTGQ